MLCYRGIDLFVAWKSATAAGLDKLDYSNKCENAFIETMQLTPQSVRDDLSSSSKIFVNYVNSHSSGAGIRFAIKKQYEDDFREITGKHDKKRMQYRLEERQTSVVSLQAKIMFDVEGNSSPDIESISIKV